MPAYLIAQIDVLDAEKYAAYAAKAGPVVAQYGGTFRAKAGPTRPLEGEPPRERIVVIEFESMDAAETYYKSAEYQAAKALRDGAARAQFFIVEGAD
jgi:uncharacterized protein (DUF1330 family)